jgi:zinc D-Ala-D-Ala carboxypeptidase
VRLQHFQLSEFDSPDEPGSGAGMSRKFLKMLDEARELSGVPFKINSGFRTPAHNRAVKGSERSSHMIGCACDISCHTSAKRYRILASLIAVGFTRVGIHDSFIHVDNDATKTPGVAWTYAAKNR